MTGRLVPRGATAQALAGSVKRGQRLRTLLVGLLTVVLLAAGSKFGVTVVSNLAGRQALTRLDYAGAQAWFANNLVLNWFEPWLAHYNTGVALFYQDSWWSAEEQFETALPLAPADKKCTVALNLAWTLEAKADSLHARANTSDAVSAWSEAKELLERLHCDDGQEQESKEDTEERLDDKLDQANQQPEQPQDSDPDASDDRQEQLEQSNQEAQQTEQDKRDELSGSSSGGEQQNW